MVRRLGKQLFKLVTIVYNSFYRLNVNSSGVHVKCSIGKDSKVMSYTEIDKNCIIGTNSFIGRNSIITKSQIGNYCSIAPYVKIGLGEHDYNNITTSVKFVNDPYNELTKNECIIGHDVWVGTGAVILRGVKVGTGAIVGANAVVTKDVPEYGIVVGVPAKLIKFRFTNEKITRIMNSSWWEKEPNEIKKIFKKLNSQND